MFLDELNAMDRRIERIGKLPMVRRGQIIDHYIDDPNEELKGMDEFEAYQEAGSYDGQAHNRAPNSRRYRTPKK